MAQGNTRKVIEVFDVDGNEFCSDLPVYPIDPTRGNGGLLEDTPVLCGSSSFTTECYSYVKASNTWQLLGNLVTGRGFFGAGIFRGALWVTGGRQDDRGNQKLDSTETIALDGTVSSGTNLPNGRHGHSMVVLNNDEFMILGAADPSNLYKNTMTYNANSGTFTDGPSMIHNRRDATCSMFQSKFHNDRQVVLCAGGISDSGTAELLDFSQENAQWEEGMNFKEHHLCPLCYISWSPKTKRPKSIFLLLLLLQLTKEKKPRCLSFF